MPFADDCSLVASIFKEVCDGVGINWDHKRCIGCEDPNIGTTTVDAGELGEA